MAINFINYEWTPCHVTMGLFEALDSSRATMANQIKAMLARYPIPVKIFTYIKEESSNICVLASALNNMICCATLIVL